MPINTFDTKTEYNEHTKSATESEVSFIKDLNDVKFDGVNVHVTTPKFGDAVYIDNVLDENGQYRKHFIDGASLNPSLLPNTYTPVGVVFANENNKILIVYYKGTYTITKVIDCVFFEIIAKTDGKEHSIQFRQPKYTSGEYLQVGTFTHSCSTQEQFAQELDTWLRANQGGIAAGGDWDYNWHCEYMENYEGIMKPFVVVSYDSNIAYSRVNSNNSILNNPNSNIAVAQNTMMNYVPMLNSSIGYLIKTKTGSVRSVINYAKALQYYATTTSVSNPISMVDINSTTIYSKTQFEENQWCADLRSYYGTYENYIKHFCFAYPTLKRNQGAEYNKSLEWTKILASKTYKDFNNNTCSMFPCAAWSQTIGVNSKGLEVGNWYLPNAQECYKLCKDLTYGLSGITIDTCDQLSKTLYKMDGTLITADITTPCRATQSYMCGHVQYVYLVTEVLCIDMLLFAN